MGLLSRFFSGRKSAQGSPRRVVARFDAASDSPENRRHWSQADALSPNAALSPRVRRTLRMRSRYEIANNSYAKGIVDTLANDIVGIGPRLQIQGEDGEIVESLWKEWARAVCLCDKLRLAVRSAIESGEVFLRLGRNDELDSRVKFDLRLIEADQVAQPGFAVNPSPSDGIEFDAFGNPKSYSVLKQHPGSTSAEANDADPVPARQIIHYFRADRPGQVRGIPWLTPALPLFAQLRRFTLAALTSAEAAANIAMAIGTDAPASDEDDEPQTMDTFELPRGTVTVLPAGYKLSQVSPSQPSASYEMFKREILNEMARAINMPFNIAAGNSASYNYASGRLDHQTYDLSIRVLREHLEVAVLDRLFAEFFREAQLIEGSAGLPQSMRARDAVRPERHWLWQAREHVDPAKEATGQAQRLENGTTTLQIECAERGLDWRDVVRQRAEEMKELERLGLAPADAVPVPAIADDEDDEQDDER